MIQGVVLDHDPELGLPQVGNIILHPRQIPAFLSTRPITLCLAGIRGGKTHVGALKSIIYAMMHPCDEDETHLVCSPTYSMSKVPVEKIFKLLYDKTIFPVCPLISYRRSERMFILAAANGGITRIIVRSLHEPDRIRGIKVLSAWLDEAAYITKYAWEVVQGRLADVAGPCWITTTPDGYNWVYDLYEEAVREMREGVPEDERQIKLVHWASTSNPFINQRGMQRLQGRYDAKAHAQEVEARFVRGRGLIYHAFGKHNLVTRGLNPKLPLWIGQDFNVDPMASVFCQPFTNTDGLSGAHIFHELKKPDWDTYALVRYLQGYCSENKIPLDKVTIFPDASGAQRSTSGKSDFKILRQAGFRVDAPTKNPLVKDRINCVNGLLKPVFSKAPRLTFDPSCQETLKGLRKQIWKPESDPPEPDKTMGFDHLNDALGYVCWRKWPLKRVSTAYPARRAA